jgi:hypothetical protein
MFFICPNFSDVEVFIKTASMEYLLVMPVFMKA